MKRRRCNMLDKDGETGLQKHCCEACEGVFNNEDDSSSD